MLPLPTGREASAGVGALSYERQRPERTLLYQLVQECYPAFKAHLAAQGTVLPGYVEREFEDYLKCGRLEHGFLRVRCEDCKHEHLVAFCWPLLRIPARAALVIPFTSQAPRVLCQLRRMADDCRDAGGTRRAQGRAKVGQCRSNCRECRAARGRGVSRTACAPAGVERLASGPPRE